MKKLFLIFLLLQLLSCSGQDNNSSNSDSFIEKVKTDFVETEIASRSYPQVEELYKPLDMAVDSRGRMIVADGSTNIIHLLEKDGTVISRNGGEGRGPSEFEIVNDMFIDHNDRLYVLDKGTYRVSTFNILEDSLIYQTSYSLEQKAGFYIESIFTNWEDIFGVFSKMEIYQSGENNFHLHKLDDEFNPDDHLLEMSGNDNIAMSPGFIDHPIGLKTFWDVYDNGFYYVSSHSMELTKVDLKTGEKETHPIYENVERANTSSAQDFLKNRMESLIEIVPEVKNAIEERDRLPLLARIDIEDNLIFYDLYYAGSGSGILVFLDKAFENMRYIKTPPYFRFIAFRDNTMYGIDYTEAEAKLMLMEINDY